MDDMTSRPLVGPWLRIAVALGTEPKTMPQLKQELASHISRSRLRGNLAAMIRVGLAVYAAPHYRLTDKALAQMRHDPQ